MGKRNSRMSNNVKKWVHSTDDVQVSNIDRKTFIGKKVLKKHITKLKSKSVDATSNIIINIGERKYMIKQSEFVFATCSKCSFARYGRSSKHCPCITIDFKSTHLCTTFGNGKVEYFSDVTEVLKA